MIPMIGETANGSGEEGGNGELSMSAIEQFITSDKQHPFCVYVATHEPHAPWTKGDRSAYDPAKLKIPPYLVDTPETRGGLSAYYAVVTYMDAEVGTLMRLLEKTGHTADTLFLFVSEQGSSVPHGKWTLYDPGIRVAAIARWPGKIKPGSENNALVQYVDVLPTLLAAAGANPAVIDTGCPDAAGNRGFDGRSFSTCWWARARICAMTSSRSTRLAASSAAPRRIHPLRLRWSLETYPESALRHAVQ